MTQDEAKQAAAAAALELLPEEGVIGLGSGSTAKLFIDGVGKLVKAGRKLKGVPTSDGSRAQAQSLGIELCDDQGPWDIALCVDGADEVSAALDLVKGGGGAHTREKIVNFSSRQNIIIVDDTKLSEKLGRRWPVPVEVLAFAHKATAHALGRFGETGLRLRDGKPWMTDAGNYIYDVRAGEIDDPAALDAELHRVPGVVETGLFIQRADLVLVAGADGIRRLERAR